MITSENLAEDIKRFILRNDLINVKGVGVEQEISTKLALPRVITLVMGNLAELSEQTGGQQAVYNMANEASQLDVLDVEKAKQEVALMPERGAELVKSVQKDRYFGTINSVVSTTGIKQDTVVDLINLVVPVTLGMLGKQVAANQWGPDELAQSLQTLSREMPPPVTTQPALLPLQEQWLPTLTHETTPPPRFRPASTVSTTNKWLIAALVVATAELGYIIGSETKKASNDTAAISPNTESYATSTANMSNNGVWDPNNPAALTANGNFDRSGGGYVYGDAGVPAVLKLKDGLQQIIGANSTENKLYQFLVDPRLEVDKVSPSKGWIGFDRIYFESSKAVLTNESMWQLSNVASILKTFPNAKVRIGGYTDTSGDPAFNLKLSRERAESARATLIKFGVDPNSIEAVGYGSLDNIASNDTPDGRSLNRRVSIRVIDK
ncbi:OmpA family protein [Hymenobacter sp. YC55]|uniref:OmpA family protein n=1 Tax=Hymenobacter sp. YC55 TaxID=3034019 RepID=UPI0023F794E2|nr:OmpA family protein [Hymenobacter sp. YC55]MDF7810633.1 OmpA family protein [Hymenobacter sp. YC55]